MRLAVVIVNYNVRDLLRACLASVQASAALTADKLDVDIIVVDNASHDDSVAMVAADFPDVHLIALDENIGFTGANNLALAQLGFNTAATHPVTLSPCHLCLPRPRPPPQPRHRSRQTTPSGRWSIFSKANPSAGICGANLIYGDGSFQHGAFHFPSLAQVTIDLFPLPTVRGMHRLHDSALNGRYPAALWQGHEPFPVDFVLGAALMARADAIRAVGGLDDEYFMYCEEMDWCLRLAKAGWLGLCPARRPGHSPRRTEQPTGALAGLRTPVAQPLPLLRQTQRPLSRRQPILAPSPRADIAAPTRRRRPPSFRRRRDHRRLNSATNWPRTMQF